MITCPRCGTVNGVRIKNPVKCTRCWYVFEKWEGANVGLAEIDGGGKVADRGVREGSAGGEHGAADHRASGGKRERVGQDHGGDGSRGGSGTAIEVIELSGRGVEGNADSSSRAITGNVSISEKSRLGRRAGERQGVEQVSSPAAPTENPALVSKAIMDKLKDICAGKIPNHVQEPEPEPESEEAEVLYCRIAECGQAMVQTKGWWVCPDVGGCPMGGIQQKKVV